MSRNLLEYSGVLDIREHSSGGKHNRFGITKQGNRFFRTAFIEANQRGYRTTQLSSQLRARRRKTDPDMIAIADRCLQRLNKKGNRLLIAGKHPNKVKVACASEMVHYRKNKPPITSEPPHKKYRQSRYVNSETATHLPQPTV
ncbi:MAG: transposase [Granulosicoccus sp.]